TLCHYSFICNTRRMGVCMLATLHNKEADLTIAWGEGVIALVVVNLVSASEHLVVGESRLELFRLVEANVAGIGDTGLVAEIVEVLGEILREVLTVEVLDGRSRRPFSLHLQSLLNSVDDLHVVEVDALLVEGEPRLDLLVVLGGDLSIGDLDRLVLLLERVDEGCVSGHRLLEGSEVELGEVSGELRDDSREGGVLSLQFEELGSVLKDESLAELGPVDRRGGDTLRSHVNYLQSL
ncbi:hypothetical protein PENTCL1PPCAC_1748, partial [Pristionchus entomophagus]